MAQPAAFGRLCVETARLICRIISPTTQPPSGGCVLKPPNALPPASAPGQPPSGGCVLKLIKRTRGGNQFPSRLRAAVC